MSKREVIIFGFGLLAGLMIKWGVALSALFDPFAGLVGVVGTLFFLAIYFVPAAIAYHRGHNNFMPIFLVNFLFGWTVIGYFAALIWSTSDNVSPAPKKG